MVIAVVGDWQDVVELVINVKIIGKLTLGAVVLVNVGVVNVNVPDPVPDTPLKATTAVPLLIVPDTDQPWVDATLETVML